MKKSKPIVCIIDDDVSVRTSLIGLIEITGLGVQAYGSAESFLQAKAEMNTDFLIVDVRLPGMSGIELLEHLTKSGWSKPTAIVTGNANIERMNQPSFHDRVYILAKPSDPGKLLKIIRSELPGSIAPSC